MCGTSQRQYGLGQKQGKTLVISSLPSGGPGPYAARRRRRNLLRATEVLHFLFDGFVCCERLEIRQLKLHGVHSFALGPSGLHLVILLTEAMANGSSPAGAGVWGPAA